MNHPLKNALPIVAAAYGEKFGVKVLIQGQDAFTDGHSIVIPAANPDDPRFQQLAWGYLAHEAAHIRHTYFDMVMKAASKPIRKALLNIIEDARIEQALAQDYPGTRRTIANVLENMVTHGQMAVPETDQPAANLQAWLLFRLRSRFLGQAVSEPLYQQVDAQLRSLLSAGVMSRLSAMAATVTSLNSTGDALKLADAILNMLEEESEPTECQGSSSQDCSPQDCSPQGHDDTGRVEVADDDQSGQPSSGATVAQGSSGDDAAEVERGNLQKILSATDDQLGQDTFKQVAGLLTEQADQHHGVTPMSLPVPEMALPGSIDILALSATESAQIRARLRGMVQSNQDSRPHAKRHGCHIASHRLAGSQAGESRLFIQRMPRVAPNAAVHLLVDISGSMGKAIGDGDRKYHHIANEAALALALALEGIPGVTPAVSFFPGLQQDVAIALRPKQSVRHQAARFDQRPRGSTPMASAMWFAANDLLQQKQKRKLMIVLTDGDPDDWAATHDIVDRCRRSGFELLGIGIQTRSVEKFFPLSIVIGDVKDLKRALFEVTQRLLLTA